MHWKSQRQFSYRNRKWPKTNALISCEGFAKRQTALNDTVADDMRPFHTPDNDTFLRLPTSKRKGKKDIGVTVTCTALMALAATRSLAVFYCGKKNKPKDVQDRLDAVFAKLLAFQWASSGLKQNNAFTVALVIRTAGLLCRDVASEPAIWRKKKRQSEDREIKDDRLVGSPIVKGARRLSGRTLEEIARARCSWYTRQFGYRKLSASAFDCLLVSRWSR